MQTSLTRYEDNVSFYSLFEADTFDVEEKRANGFVGYVRNEAGDLLIAGMFINDAEGKGGWGWYNDEVV